MRQDERDFEQLHVILRNFHRLEASHTKFGHNYETFAEDTTYQDSCALCLIQIGEAVNRLSPDFVSAHPEIDWHRIYGMRCHLVHGYEMFDAEIVWDALETGIPPLRVFCEQRVG